MVKWEIQYRDVGCNEIRTIVISKPEWETKRDIQREFSNSSFCNKIIRSRTFNNVEGSYRIREFVNCKMIKECL